MRRVVLDTNIPASGAIALAGTLASVIDAWHSGEFRLITSQSILLELERTFEKPYFRQRLTPEQCSRFTALLQRRATFTQFTVQVQGVATHPEDDLIIATAVSARADYLVTGDTKFQDLGTYQGVAILSPREFLEILAAEELKKG
jgi:putative PIN family toxin of toxin-antitoxin system